MPNFHLEKGLVLIVILLLSSITVAPSTATNVVLEKPSKITKEEDYKDILFKDYFRYCS